MKYDLIQCSNFYVCDQSKGGELFSGNKFIKNKYILKNKKKNLISIGSKYSNHCLSLAFYSRKINVKFIYLLVGLSKNKLFNIKKYPNIRIAKQFGSKVILLNKGDLYKKVEFYKKKYSNYRWIPSGGHNKQAISAYSNFAYNFLLKNFNVIRKLKWILITIGSGTSFFGFLNAILKLNLKIKLIGVTVFKTKKQFLEVATKTFSNNDLKKIEIIDDYHGKYGKKLKHDKFFAKKFYSENGILIDPIYNIRAVRYLYKNKLKNGLYINTGGCSNIIKK
jgi:1-aminocyclopropane-1-carboxylate deaminase/D-cysteine desulfhydrase-like pyridoxal-dependent ACC family enzyme